MKLFWLLVALACGAASAQAAPPVAVAFGPAGLASLRVGTQELLWRNPGDGSHGAFDGGTFWVPRITLRGADGRDTVLEGGGPSRVAADPAHGTVTRTFAWGIVRGRFTPSGDRLGLTLTVTNTTHDTTVQAVTLQPLWLRFPQKPPEYAQEYPLLTACRDEPGVVRAGWGTGRLALCQEDVRQPLLIGFPFALDRPADTIFPLQVSSGPTDWRHDLLAPYLVRPIPPGRTDTYRLSLRFGRADTSDLDQRFAAAFPPRLRWADRRPIGYLILSSTVPHPPGGKNPRGWFGNDAGLDVTTEAGRAVFAKRLEEYADGSIRVLKAMHAQGMITWDIEGQEYPHATSYIGDPRQVTRLAPEMGPLADAYFARFRRAGLEVGVCLRPSTLVRAADGSASQHDPSDMAAATQTLIDRALYANRRWGCTLFYIDSNGDPNVPYPASVFAQVAAALARQKITALLVPEHQSAGYYGLAAPYDEVRGGVVGTPDAMRRIYPGAFTVLNTSDGDLAGHHGELVQSVRRGDILLFRAWWDDPQNAEVRAIYAQARPERAIIPAIMPDTLHREFHNGRH